MSDMSNVFTNKACEDMINEFRKDFKESIEAMRNYGGACTGYDIALSKALESGVQMLMGAIHLSKNNDHEMTALEHLKGFKKCYCEKEIDKYGVDICKNCYFSCMQCNTCLLNMMYQKVEREVGESSENPNLLEYKITFSNLFDACRFAMSLAPNSVKSFSSINGGASGWEIVYYK